MIKFDTNLIRKIFRAPTFNKGEAYHNNWEDVADYFLQ